MFGGAMNLSFTINTSGKYGEVNAAIIDKLKNNRNEVSVPIGAGEFTKSEWERFISRFDKALEAAREARGEQLKQEESTKPFEKNDYFSYRRIQGDEKNESDS